MHGTGWLLAHQGGWDEMLFVAIPIAIFAGLLWMANKRAKAQLDAQAAPPAEAADEPPPGPDRG